MKLFIICITAFLFQSGTADLEKIRTAYRDAAHDKTRVDAFYEMLADVNRDSDPSMVAYKGAAIALKAKYEKTVREKKEGFIEGISLVEYAIEKAPGAVEPRFVRLGIQENTPKALKYKSNIEEDKHFILTHFENIPSKDLKNHIKNYISLSALFSAEEKTVISGQ